MGAFFFTWSFRRLHQLLRALSRHYLSLLDLGYCFILGGFSGRNSCCGWGGLLALVLLGLVLVVVMARVDCQCLSWLQWIVSVCHESSFEVIMVVVLRLFIRWVLWGGFGFVVVMLAVSILLEVDLFLGFSRQCGLLLGPSWCSNGL